MSTEFIEIVRAPLLLIRGLPGTGKSTMAMALKHVGQYDVHLEADMYHMKKGEYVYAPAIAAEAHRWCLTTTCIMLNNGFRVVVSNTFVRLEDIAPYQKLGFEVAIQEASGAFKSVHNVPDEIIDHMRSRWQELP